MCYMFKLTKEDIDKLMKKITIASANNLKSPYAFAVYGCNGCTGSCQGTCLSNCLGSCRSFTK